MQLNTFLLSIALLGALIFSGIEYREVATQRSEIAKLQALTGQLNAALAELRKPKLAPAAAVTTASKVICPACKGEAKIIYDGGHSRNPVDRKSQTCPVCAGVGYRMLAITPGTKVCPDCQGMGKVYSRDSSDRVVQLNNCPRCGASGLIADIKPTH